MGVIELPENRCEFCKKREATKQCDKVVGLMRYAGHPPRINGIPDWSIPMENIMTCDKLICDKCSTHITGMDVCPKCLKEIKEVLGAKK